MTSVKVLGGFIAAALAIAAVPLIMGLAGPLGEFENPNISCGGHLPIVDSGPSDAGEWDAGWAITQITTAGDGFASIMLENPTSTPVYLGGSTVQPLAHVAAICTDTATCASARVSIDARTHSLYCTNASTATQIRTLAGGF